MKREFLFAAVVLLAAAGNAQQCLPDSGFWGDFAGKLGDRDIVLSIYRSADGSLSGDYRYINNEKKVFALTGNEKDCTYYLDAKNDPHEQVGKFRFQYKYDKVKKTDNYTGIFTGADNKQNAVSLQLNSMVGGTLTQRYFELFGTTQEVDSFATKIKTAFINNDKQWLAAHCRYPLEIYKGNTTPVIVKDEKKFVSAYNRYFTQAYRDKFKKMKCYNMFSNHVGAMMGRGEIKINHTGNSTKEKYEYCITGIEVFF